METAGYIVRRANLDDLPVLKALWDVARLPTTEFEKRLTEFQLVARPDDVVLGALGLRVVGAQALIHGEAFYSPRQADEARPALWRRLQALAGNRGVARFWMSAPGAPFWSQAGFRPATPADLNWFPMAFGSRQAKWLTFQLRDDALLSGKLDREFERLQVEQRVLSDRLRRQALIFKWIAGLIAVGFGIGALILLVRLLDTAAG